MVTPSVFCNATSYTFAQTLESNCTHILNNLVIASIREPTLEALNHLAHVGGSLLIVGNPLLTNLTGLGALAYVGAFTIAGNEALTTLDGLTSLTTVGSVSVQGNERLLHGRGLCSVPNVGSVDLRLGVRDYFSMGFCLRTGFTGSPRRGQTSEVARFCCTLLLTFAAYALRLP